MTAEVPHSAVPPRRVQTGRVRALLLDPMGREVLDRVVRLAAQALRAPFAIVGVPEFRRIQIASGVGVPEPWVSLGYLPLEASFCRHVLAAGEPFTVEDAARHPIAYAVPRLENLPRVAYCGVPLRVAGEVVAVLSVCDVEPRRWTAEDLGALRDLAEGLARELEGVTARLDQIMPIDRPRPMPEPRPRVAAPEPPVPVAAVGEREERYRRIFEDSLTPLFVMSAEGRFIEVNRAFEELLSRRRDMIVSRSLEELSADADSAAHLLDQLRAEGTVVDVDVVLRGGDMREIVCAVTAHRQEGDTPVYHGMFRDITAQKRSEAELVRNALQDPLTGLPNRLVFMDRLDRLITQAQRRPDYRFAVIFLDLDNFKGINDTHGHGFGDQLLIASARRLEACLRQGDTVARMGGDEFAVLLDAVHDSASVTWVVDRIQAELAEPFAFAGRSTLTTASIGIAITSGGHEHASDLLRNADAAMYRAKASGRNRYVIFDAGMHERALEQRQLEHDLREALLHQQLKLHYQPVVELVGGTVTGLEALVRWAHPARGILLPDDFIPLAEQTGLIIEIGWWVLREACRQLRAWQDDFPQAAFRLTMSVNLSAKQFVHPHLIDKIDEILAETDLEPHHLRLDLTEAVVMHNVDLAARLLRLLRDRGIQICIDDFGTGFSSIRQLRAFPISTLKIDRSFVGRLGEGTDSREIVQSIIAIGRSMSIDAIAEGVETPEQLDMLRRLGTRFAQGFLFSLPLDSRAASHLLQNA